MVKDKTDIKRCRLLKSMGVTIPFFPVVSQIDVLTPKMLSFQAHYLNTQTFFLEIELLILRTMILVESRD